MKLDILCNTAYLIRSVLEQPSAHATHVLENWSIALALPNSSQPRKSIRPNHKETNSNVH